jgi:hypothetical protein
MEKYKLLLKAARKIFDDRNQEKSGFRSRKSVTQNNQRLL